MIGLVAAAFAALHLGAASASAGTLDQQQTDAPTDCGMFTDQHCAQVFTAGITGGLDQVDLSLVKSGTPPASITVEIRTTSSGSPGHLGSVVGTSNLPISAVGGTLAFVPVTFASPVPVTAGTQYAIVAYSAGTPGNAAGWGLHTASDAYPGGTAFYSTQPLPPDGLWTGVPTSDHAFKTYVVPAPSTTGQQAAALKKCKKLKSKPKRRKCRKRARKLPV